MGFLPAQIGSGSAHSRILPERTATVPSQKQYLQERIGIDRARKAFLPEQKGFLPEQKGFLPGQ